MRRVLVIVFDGVQPLDVTAPSSVFSGANFITPGSYELIFASPHGGTVATNGGLSFADTRVLREVTGPIDTVLISGANEVGLRSAIFEDGVAEWVREHSASVRRVGSVCTGAFVLAAAGLLDDRRATTHWEQAELLQSLCPASKVESDAIFVFDGNLFTSAGVTAAIDVCLALVEQDLGRAVAAEVARQLVVYLRRAGGQSQYSHSLQAQAEATDTIRDITVWVSEHLHEPLGIDTLALKFGMSQRNFARRFRKETGQSPAAYIAKVRVERARGLLTETDLPIRVIAERCGFGSIDSLERAFRTIKGIAARDYRERFFSSLVTG